MGGDNDDQQQQPQPQQQQVTVYGTAEFAKYSLDQQTTYAVATLKAPEYETATHIPIDLVVALDVSGSMSGPKLDLAKQALQFIIKNLRNADRLALVVYDTDVAIKFGLTAMDAAGKQSTAAQVEALRAGSSTNLSGGLLQALNIINTRVNPHDVGSVLLFTDGLANVGISSTPDLVAAMRGVFNPVGKYSVHTFGFGADHNATLLQGLSEAGNGMYFYVKDVDEIPAAFADCLGGLLSTVGQTIEVKLEAVNDCYIANIHTTKPFKFAAGNKVVVVTLGDIQSEEEKDILFEVGLPQLAVPNAEAPAVQITVSYFNCPLKQQAECSAQLVVSRTADWAQDRPASLKVQRQKYRMTATAAMKEAKGFAESGDLTSARRRLETEMVALSGFDDCFTRELMDDVKQVHEGMASRDEYRSRGSKVAENCWQSHSEQRSNVAAHSRGYVSYATSAKAYMKSAFK